MSNRDKILATARRLAITSGSVPSLDAIAAAAEVSKGGLMHHFKTRSALLEGLAEQAIDSMDEALDAAVPRGQVVETWLRLSMSRDDADLNRALLMSFADVGDNAGALLKQAAAASQRWERLLAAELGDPVAASIVRLLGDGMVINSLSSDSLPPLEAILARVQPTKTAP